MVYLIKTFIGIFALGEDKEVISFKPFPKDANIIATKLMEEEPKELQQIKNELKNKQFITDKEIENFVKKNFLKYEIEYRFVKNQIEFNQFLTKVNSELTKLKIKESVGRDTLIIHVNNAIEELDKSINIFVERLRELYSLHFPEMDRIIENHETYVQLIEKFGDRKNLDDKRLNQFKEKSSGMDFNEQDVNAVKMFASNITKLYELRESLSKYLSTLLKEIAPNFSALAGDMIAAKLMSRAGGLERLSLLPSSTLQLLGSEKALFRFLKSKGRSKSPKFGLIYNHPLIQNSPKDKQGKIARLLASKLVIAARIDYYSKEYKGDKIKKELEDKIKKILSS
jgi:nucleolar protein 56